MPRITASLASWIASGGSSAICTAIATARFSTSASGTTSLTRFISLASLAPKMSPVSTYRIALNLPTVRGKRWVPPPPGIMPIFTSGWPNFADSPAMMTSQVMASSQPPPSAKPLTAAITGFGQP